MYASQMAGMMPSFWPVPEGLVYISGLGLILAGASIILNIKARLATMLLALFLLIVILVLIAIVGMLTGKTTIIWDKLSSLFAFGR